MGGGRSQSGTRWLLESLMGNREFWCGFRMAGTGKAKGVVDGAQEDERSLDQVLLELRFWCGGC
jgi:hypothetical protein